MLWNCYQKPGVYNHPLQMIIKTNSSMIIESIDDLRKYHLSIVNIIRQRLNDFSQFKSQANNSDLFRELAYCILTANASARMGLKSINALDSTLFIGTANDITQKLKGVYRFPNSRADYIVRSRKILEDLVEGNIQRIFSQYDSQNELRFYLKSNIIGIGHKESSHFLRNVGYKGFAILDKHVISMLNMFGCNVDKPRNRKEYEDTEQKMKDFAKDINIDFDELDLLFWSYKTGEIIK
jgi:N-glycosylase/DNA lyase